MKSFLKNLARVFLVLVLALLLFLGWNFGVEAYRFVSDDPAVWESVIADFEVQDAQAPPGPGQVLFVGSSSIRLWSSLRSDMDPVPALGRGFGGAKIDDVRYYAERLITPYHPGAVVLYIGSNDLSGSFGADYLSNEEAERRYRLLLQSISELAPQARVYLVALKPTTRSWQRWPTINAFNQTLKQLADSRPQWRYIDANAGLFGDDGQPRADLLFFDGMHLNAEGYAVWGQALRQALMIDMLSNP